MPLASGTRLGTYVHALDGDPRWSAFLHKMGFAE
jgi:hypothetical protein